MVVFIILIFILLFLVLVHFAFKRYYPEQRIPCIEKQIDLKDNDKINTSSLHIPYAYLKR